MLALIIVLALFKPDVVCTVTNGVRQCATMENGKVCTVHNGVKQCVGFEQDGELYP